MFQLDLYFLLLLCLMQFLQAQCFLLALSVPYSLSVLCVLSGQ